MKKKMKTIVIAFKFKLFYYVFFFCDIVVGTFPNTLFFLKKNYLKCYFFCIHRPSSSQLILVRVHIFFDA